MSLQLLPFRLINLSLGLFILAAFALHAQTINFTSSPYPSGETIAQTWVDVVYSYDADAESSDGSPVRYSLRFGPAGMKVNSQTGVITWNPTKEGEFDAEIRAELIDNPSVRTTQEWKIKTVKVISHPGCTGNELWLNVGQGLPGPGAGAVVMNDELYVAHWTLPDETKSTYHLSKWNGIEWAAVSDIGMTNKRVSNEVWTGDPVGHLIAFNNNIYMTTPKEGIPSIPNSNFLARWNGSAWAGVGGHQFSGDVIDMEVVGNALYVLAYDQYGSWTTIVEKWDGTNWERIKGEFINGGVMALASIDDQLYIAGRAGPYELGLRWNQLPLFQVNGDTIELVANNMLGFDIQGLVLDLIVYNERLTLVTASSFYQWDGTSTERLPSIPGDSAGSYARTAFSFKSELYTALWNDPQPEVQPNYFPYELWRLYGNEWHPVSEMQVLDSRFTFLMLPLHFIEYKNDLFAYGPINTSCGFPLNNMAILATEREYARVSGSVYHDDNRNCTVDPNEPNLKNEIVEIQPGPFYAFTNSKGIFTTFLRPGTYAFNLSPKRYWTNSCPIPQEVRLPSPAAVVDNVNIGTDMIPGIYDVRSSLAVGQTRPGFDVTYTFTWFNVGTEPATGTAFFEYDNQLAFRSASLNPSRQNPNRLEWDFSNLPAGDAISVTITLNIPSTMAIGTELCAVADVQLDLKDNDRFLHDNVDSICSTVRGSCDPNNIDVAPVRFDPEFGQAPLLPGDTVLSYLVQFQNTGNDTAFTVIVADTLDASLLDITSIQLGAASHTFDFNISGQGILTWTFNNILLPDSNVNEPASHGYFKYTIHLKRELAPMTQIPNRASIFFDYNEPVLTNSVLSITSGTLGVDDDLATTTSMQIYPNPVRGKSVIQLNLRESAHVRLQLIDSRGEVVQVLADREMKGGEERITFDSERLPSGAYYLLLDRDGTKEIYPIVIGK